MVGCNGNGGDNGESYTLTITSTSGGSVVEPGEGTFTYYAGTEVDLVAEAEDGYQFVSWSGFLIPIVNRKAAATTIVMENDYSISANFAIPTLVWDWYDLNTIRDDMYGIYILMNDLNSTTPGYEELAGPTANGGKGWQPIGSTNETGVDNFHGTLDGGGYEIYDLFINRPDEYDAGLFGMVYYQGGIMNIGVVNAIVTGYMWVGGLVANSIGLVDNSYSISSVNGTDYVGGLVGGNGGTVSNSYSIGNVTGYQYVGGLVGRNGGSVSDCHSTDSVISGEGHVGGLVGRNGGSVSDCHSTDSVISGEGRVGGLVGENRIDSVVSNSYSTGSVSGYGAVGGLVGRNYGVVNDSYCSADVAGNITVGGLVGVNACLGDGSGTVNDCYSTANVNGENDVGGLVGHNHEGTVSNSFWDVETSGQSISAGGIGKITEEMKNIATFLDAGWGISTVADHGTRNTAYIWNIVNEVTYPFLSWQP